MMRRLQQVPAWILLLIGASVLPGWAGVTPEGLTGTSWLVEDIGGAGVIDFARTTISFSEDGRVYGDTACNRYNGGVTLDADRMSFGPLISTKRACPEAVMNQESRFLEAMGKVESWALDENGLLFLYDADGQPLIRASRIMDSDSEE